MIEKYFRLSLVSAENKLFLVETSESQKYICICMLLEQQLTYNLQYDEGWRQVDEKSLICEIFMV